MKAYVLHGVNDLRYEEINKPELMHGWALVKVKAAGICSSDVPRIFTKGTYHFPTIPGHEFSGTVVEVGNPEDEYLIDKNVGVFPLIPCKKCKQCEAKHYEMCEHYDYLGSRRDGGFAEYVAVPTWNLIELPSTVPLKTAAMLEPISVALHAARLTKIDRGDAVAIIGTGMIGICAAQWSKSIGAKTVTVVGRNESKRKIVEGCGLDYAISENNVNTVQYDKIIEAVGTPQSIEQAICMTAPGGTLLLMGNPSGDILFRQDIYWRILRKQLTVKGTWNSSFDGIAPSDWTRAVEALSNQEIDAEKLISHSFKQEDLPKGLHLMLKHEETYCKIMTEWND